SGNWASINAQSSSGFSNPSNIASVANARISGFSHGIKTPMAGEDCDLFISGATFSQMSGPAIFLGAPFSKAICFASETSASIHRGIYHGDDSAENQPAYGWSVSLA